MPRVKRTETTKEARKERVPLGRMRRKMSIPDGLIPKNKVARWINDKSGRLQAAQEGGYTFVDDPLAKVGEGSEDGRDSLDTKISRVVGTKEDGSPLKAYLMVINKSLYDADQAEKNRHLDEIDASIRRGNVEGEVGKDGRYIPSSGISVVSKVQ